MGDGPSFCEWVTLRDALRNFAKAEYGTQGAEHIKQLHWYIASRLVIEGGFHPDDITPRPPFRVEIVGIGRSRRFLLHYDPAVGGTGERSILGGLKTKKVDVTVVKDGIGPCIAVSMKGMLNAYRNLTNRMEEAVGDCTNLHLTYPALVYGFLHVLRANREGLVPESAPQKITRDPSGQYRLPDIAIRSDGKITEGIVRYHDALAGLANRNGTRNDLTRYEAIALVLVETAEDALGELVSSFPDAQSPLQFSDFFDRLYAAYDERFVYFAPELARTANPILSTRRFEWSPDSPIASDARLASFALRVAPG